MIELFGHLCVQLATAAGGLHTGGCPDEERDAGIALEATEVLAGRGWGESPQRRPGGHRSCTVDGHEGAEPLGCRHSVTSYQASPILLCEWVEASPHWTHGHRHRRRTASGREQRPLYH